MVELVMKLLLSCRSDSRGKATPRQHQTTKVAAAARNTGKSINIR